MHMVNTMVVIVDHGGHALRSRTPSKPDERLKREGLRSRQLCSAVAVHGFTKDFTQRPRITAWQRYNLGMVVIVPNCNTNQQCRRTTWGLYYAWGFCGALRCLYHTRTGIGPDS
jgi:hypothetical protein